MNSNKSSTNQINRSRYIAPYEFIINRSIQEWDIEKANISVLRDLDVISEKEYETYKNMDKQQREVAIGYRIKENPELYKILAAGIADARALFFKKYKVEDEDILYIDNDSITTIKRYKDARVDPIQIGIHTKFRLKNTYTSFYKIFFIDLLYFNNGSEEHYRLKNINEDYIKSRHTDYFLDILLYIAYTAQNDLLGTIRFVSDLYKRYTNMDLNLNCYREFNSINKFKISASNYSMYYADNITPEELKYVDIGFNASILRTLYKIFLKEYYSKLRPERRK